MSIGPQGNWVSGVVGAQVGHQRTSDTDRKSAESANQIAAANVNQQSAADGSLQANEEAQDRDGDGRDLGGHLFDGSPNDEGADPSNDAPADEHLSRDATGQIGRNLDISG